MLFFKNYIAGQTENFPDHDQVLNNLAEGEEIQYKLKTFKNSKLRGKIILSVIFVLADLFLLLRFFFSLSTPDEEINGILLFAIIMTTVVLMFWYRFAKTFPEATYYYLFMTNKRLFIIIDFNFGTDVNIINIEDIQCISYKKKKIIKRRKEETELEIISFKDVKKAKYIVKWKYTFPIKYDFPRIIIILESLLWYHKKGNQRINEIEDKLGVKIPCKFNDTISSSHLQIFNNRVVFSKKRTTSEIRFSKEFFLNYEPWTEKSGFILISPTTDSPDKVKFKIKKSSFEIIELIFFSLLLWKMQNQILIDVNKLAKLQFRTQVFKQEPSTEIIRTEFIPEIYTQEILKPFNLYVNNDEKILYFYQAKVKSYKLIISIILTIVGFISLLSFYYIIESTFPVSFLGLSLVMITGIGTIMIVIGPIWSSILISLMFHEYLFTTKKILMKSYGKISCTPYRNISSITYDNKKKFQHVRIGLKRELNDVRRGNKEIISIPYVPLKEQIFQKIMYLKKNYSG